MYCKQLLAPAKQTAQKVDCRLPRCTQQLPMWGASSEAGLSSLLRPCSKALNCSHWQSDFECAVIIAAYGNTTTRARTW